VCAVGVAMGSSIDELLLRWRDLIVRVWIMDGSYLSDGFRDVCRETVCRKRARLSFELLD